MFYCNKCAEKEGWPESIGKSHGKCEMCGEVDTCNDVPSSRLPSPYCDGHDGMIVAHAFSDGECEKCDKKITTSHIPCDKVCEECSEEHKICVICAKKIKIND